MSTTLYQYTPLQEKSSFRILYLDRANDHNAPLSLTLRETLLEKARGKFDALSYFWGPQGDIKITCSGQQISIGPNCEAALRRLRSRIRKVALFVDAICIDQKNDVEKDEQIKLMGHVYHCAKRVLIWLGPGSPRTDLAFKEIRFLYRFRCFLETRDHRPITSNRIERLRTWVWQRTEAHDLRLTRESLKFHSHYWAACLDCPYFERVWPLQETAVASRPLLICGDARMSFNAAKFAFIFMTPFLPEMLRQFPALNRFNGYEVHLALAKVFRLEKYEIWKRPEDVHQLRAVLLFVRRLNATVVSDKLFSLFTILRAFCPDFPEPQKGIRTTELWPAATVAILKAVRCLDLIVGVFPKAEDVLPSWSFDWTTDPTYYKDWDAPADVLKRATPSGTVWDNAPRLGRASQPGDKKALRTKGVRYSKVVARSPDLGVFRDWYGDAKNDDAEETNRSRFRENRPEFASASEHVARMLFEWVIPKIGSHPSLSEDDLQARVHELLIWKTIPEETFGGYFQHWYPVMKGFQYLHEDGVSNLPDICPQFQERMSRYGAASIFHDYIIPKRCWRCFFRTEDGRVGDGFHTIREGDIVVLLCWAKFPAILRPRKDDPSLYTLVSFAYIQGLVDCQTWNMKEEALEEFTLV